jgi:hypothetical protein
MACAMYPDGGREGARCIDTEGLACSVTELWPAGTAPFGEADEALVEGGVPQRRELSCFSFQLDAALV